MTATSRIVPRHAVPVVVICRDLLGDLRLLVSWLERTGHENVVLLDNASSYPPLRDYLDASPHRVLRLDRNLGHEAPWASGLVSALASVPYVVTDPDVLPDDDCPADAVEHFQHLLNRFPAFDQAGFGLHIDDLPVHYPHRDVVVAWEQPFWSREIAHGVFTAHIDTTFAVYRPGTPYKVTEALRTGSPYLARHLPWYRDPGAPVAETSYFFAHRRSVVVYWSRPQLPDVVTARHRGTRDDR